MALGKVNHRAVVEIVFDDEGRSRSEASLQAKGTEKGFSVAEKRLAVRLGVPVEHLGSGLQKAAATASAPRPPPRLKNPHRKCELAAEYTLARRLGVSVKHLREGVEQLAVGTR
jgi:hypothetical protein